MNVLTNASMESFFFKTTGSPADLAVVSFNANEWMSLPFTLSATLASSSEITSFDTIIGQEALLTIINNDLLAGAQNRYFHGLIRRFEHTGMSGRKYLYEAEVIPAVFRLSLRKNSRIFQNMHVQDIVKQLLEESGVTSEHYRFALQNEQRMRRFCVQYQESDLEFITRLLGEEGIFYFFEHYPDKHVIVFADTGIVHVPIKGNPCITFNPNGGMVAKTESVHSFTFSQRLVSDAFAHKNFNFKKPSLDLSAKKAASQQTNLEVYEYPALHVTEERGNALAKARLEQLTAMQKQGHGQSSSCRLTSGYNFTLINHESSSLNIEYLLTDVSHAGSQPQSLEETSQEQFSYKNIFTVIPAQTTYRPTAPRQKPVVKGVQSAVVVGPEGEEIYTDEYGRIKVQFHWDREGQRNEKSSCWLRIGQPWSGNGWGMITIPRIGDEVLVDFIDGDPDRPIITGSVNNAQSPALYPLPANKTQSGIRTRSYPNGGRDNFHELRFEDKKGSEEIYLQSEKDWNILVKNDKGQNVGHDETLNVKNNRTKSVGVDQSETVGANKSIEVGANHTESIGGSMSLSVGATKTETVAINSMENVGLAKQVNVGGAYTVTVVGAMNTAVGLGQFEEVGLSKQVFVGKNLKIQAGDSVEIVCGKSRISMDKNGKIHISGSDIEIGGSDHIQLSSEMVDIN